MGPPPELDAAAVLYWTPIDNRHRPTGKCRHYVGGELLRSVAGLAIVKYAGEEGYYLLYCDPDWNSLTDTWHESLEKAYGQAAFEFEGVADTWSEAQ
ncbi:MAG: hypothetical protein ACYSWU_12215 [Planctomycetota bacterium]|jgi:hypothetical protein